LQENRLIIHRMIEGKSCQTQRSIIASNVHVRGPADYLAVCTGDSDCLRCLTITHEEIFHEPRDYCKRQTRSSHFARRKFFMCLLRVLPRSLCRSLFPAVTGYKLLLPDWRGYLIGFFALVWVANQYMSIYSRVRLDIQHQRIEIKAEQQEMNRQQEAA